jgi:hypothetical protein
VGLTCILLSALGAFNYANVYGYSAEDLTPTSTTTNFSLAAEQRFINPELISVQNQFETSSPSLALRLDQQVELTDIRAIMLDRFFASKGSPLAGHGSTFIKYCVEYGAPSDCTTIPAIAFAETDYCKAPWSLEMHNCWGFGGAGSNRIKFSSFDAAIKLITDRLVNQYGNWFLQNPRQGAETYCGANCPNWSGAVEFARYEINNFSINNGYGKLF